MLDDIDWKCKIRRLLMGVSGLEMSPKVEVGKQTTDTTFQREI